MTISLPKLLGITLVVFGVGILAVLQPFSQVLSVADHVVISEIQIGGDGAYDEFVELYNPKNEAVGMSGWKLIRINDSGSPTNLDSNISGTIAAHGYYLIGNPSYNGQAAVDETYSNTGNGIALNDVVVLYDESDAVIDKVGMGAASEMETAAAPLPEYHQSIERKATSTSTLADLLPGGSEALDGNGEDSNNNANDFVLRLAADPQNSNYPLESLDDDDGLTTVALTGGAVVPAVSTTATGEATVEINLANNTYAYVLTYHELSGIDAGVEVKGMAGVGAESGVLHPMPVGLPKHGVWVYEENQEAEIVAGLTYIEVASGDYPNGEIRGQVVFEGITPTSTPEPTPTPTEEPTPTVEPTETPTPTPTEEPMPTPEPTAMPAPTPTEEPNPTPEPTNEPTPTDEPSPTPTLEPTPIPTPAPGGRFEFLNVVCERRYIPFRLFWRTIYFPHMVCWPRGWMR